MVSPLSSKSRFVYVSLLLVDHRPTMRTSPAPPFPAPHRHLLLPALRRAATQRILLFPPRTGSGGKRNPGGCEGCNAGGQVGGSRSQLLLQPAGHCKRRAASAGAVAYLEVRVLARRARRPPRNYMGRSFSEDAEQNVDAQAVPVGHIDRVVIDEPSGGPPDEQNAEREPRQNLPAEALNNTWRGISYDSRRRKWQSKVHFGRVKHRATGCQRFSHNISSALVLP